MVRQGSVRDIRYRGYEFLSTRGRVDLVLTSIPMNRPGTNFSSLFPGIKPHLLTLGKTLRPCIYPLRER
jgi:hypothetical protein